MARFPALALVPLLAAGQPAADDIPLAGAEAGAVRVPSAPGAWGGPRTGTEPTLADRVADYQLEAVLDPVRHSVDGKERLTWRNRSDRPVGSLYFHLYLNAFDGPGSTFMTEKARYGGLRGGVEVKDGEGGSLELRKVRQAGKALSWAYVHPDGGPQTDRSVVRVDLAEPVPARGAAVLDLEFFDRLPRVVARSGYFGTFHLVAQWFPKVGVLELPGERGATSPRWNCHEYHFLSEFYADFGAYQVTIVAPREYVVGAVGEEQGPPREVPGGLARRFVQGDVHDFAFAADRAFRELTAGWDGPGSPHVTVRVLHRAEDAAAARATLEATVEALGYFSSTLGPYPYRTSTAVVPPFNALEAGGMEYETFFTSVPFNRDPRRAFTALIAQHEFGHGYFMGMLASNEFEEPFLDEGLDELWGARSLGAASLPVRFPVLAGLGIPTFRLDWWDYLRLGGAARYPADPIAGNSWKRYSTRSYGLVYSRTALVFHDLGELLGEEALARAMREYYRHWRFRHPSTADLRAAFENVSGRKDLVDAWFEAQVYSAQPVDDRVEALETTEALPQPGMRGADGERVEVGRAAVDAEIRERRRAFRKEQPAAKPWEGPFPWRSVVKARRYGAHVPQRLVVAFEDGTTEVAEWAAGEAWHRWEFERSSCAVSAQLDPGRRWLLDVDKLDDGRTRDPRRLAARRWTLETGAWLQIVVALLESL
jgi:hypothetical protein